MDLPLHKALQETFIYKKDNCLIDLIDLFILKSVLNYQKAKIPERIFSKNKLKSES